MQDKYACHHPDKHCDCHLFLLPLFASTVRNLKKDDPFVFESPLSYYKKWIRAAQSRQAPTKAEFQFLSAIPVPNMFLPFLKLITISAICAIMVMGKLYGPSPLQKTKWILLYSLKEIYTINRSYFKNINLSAC